MPIRGLLNYWPIGNAIGSISNQYTLLLLLIHINKGSIDINNAQVYSKINSNIITIGLVICYV